LELWRKSSLLNRLWKVGSPRISSLFVKRKSVRNCETIWDRNFCIFSIRSFFPMCFYAARAIDERKVFLYEQLRATHNLSKAISSAARPHIIIQPCYVCGRILHETFIDIYVCVYIYIYIYIYIYARINKLFSPRLREQASWRTDESRYSTKNRSRSPRADACFSTRIKCIKSFSAHDQSWRGKSNLENTLF